jgi:hypothetical protein
MTRFAELKRKAQVLTGRCFPIIWPSAARTFEGTDRDKLDRLELLVEQINAVEAAPTPCSTSSRTVAVSSAKMSA